MSSLYLLLLFLMLTVMTSFDSILFVDARSTHPGRVTTPTGLGLLGVTHTGGSNKKNNKKHQNNRRGELSLVTLPSSSSSTTYKNSSNNKNPIYQWGNMGYDHRLVKEPLGHKLKRYINEGRLLLIEWIEMKMTEFREWLSVKNVWSLSMRLFRVWVFWYFSRSTFKSLYDDRWHNERDPEDFFGSGGIWITKGTAHKEVVRNRVNRGKRNRKWVGIGYTPRLVWLAGALLRGTLSCTSVKKVFNPKLTSWGAGTVFATKITHQEWVSAFMIGWFFSEYYWTYVFGCEGPPGVQGGFEGIPITIQKVRFFGKVQEKEEHQ